MAFCRTPWAPWVGLSHCILQALLREAIVSSYNKYSDKGFMPIYAKESLKKAYKAYAALGGNDVASELYNKMLKMEEEKE